VNLNPAHQETQTLRKTAGNLAMSIATVVLTAAACFLLAAA